jgi:tRNA (cytidine32/uridine32-2'-O)-methyltransferase
MKNMGLNRLTVVGGTTFDPMTARWMSPGCEDIFSKMQICRSLDDALVGVQNVVASTARHRKFGQTVLEPKEVAQQICGETQGAVTAILFGREDHGLSKAEVATAGCIVQIPTPPHASLNLGQAVLVICHAIFEEFRKYHDLATGRLIKGRRGTKSTVELQDKGGKSDLADWPEMERAAQAVVNLLQDTGYTRRTSPHKVALTIRSVLQQMNPTRQQVDILRGLVSHFERQGLPQTKDT